MDNKQSMDKERPLIVVGPDGRTLHMQGSYQDPGLWETVETEDALLLVARPQSQQKKADLLATIAAYTDDHLREKITLRDMAKYCGVSVSTITQMFQKRLGTTFHSYLTRRRMAVAEELIRSGMPLEEINRQVGYTDYSSFYRAFRQVYGISPREFKQKDKIHLW